MLSVRLDDVIMKCNIHGLQPSDGRHLLASSVLTRMCSFDHVFNCCFFVQGFFFLRSWSRRLRPKKLHASVAVPAAPVRVPSQRPLASSVASITSVANYKGDNKMIPGAVHTSPDICLTAEENPRKPQIGDRLMKG